VIESCTKDRRTWNRILEEKMDISTRMEGGQSCPTVCRDVNVAPTIVTTIMKNADKIKETMETARRKTAATLRYSHGPVIGKME
jgi:hypothetical protein